MSDRKDTLLTYPYVRVRVACDYCNRKGGYRLARLAEKFGANIPLYELLKRLAHPTCGHRPENQRKGKRWSNGERKCLAYFPDLESPMPPLDLPPAPVKRGLSIVEPDGSTRRPRKRAGNV